jgi:cellulose synthase/poly-beta-1,6-N-acetylglucosamine synthase-like glycosyltransferase
MFTAWPGPSILALVASGALLAGVSLVLGYVGRLRWLISRRVVPDPRPLADWPSVDVIVPVYNELQLVDTKLRNLTALDYPGERVRFWIVDGGSDDGTLERVEQASRQDDRFSLIRQGTPNKVWQLSSALKRGRGDWILVTDADATLPPETLCRMVTEGENGRRPQVPGVSGQQSVLAVGSSVGPVCSHPLERLYWGLADRLRLLESRCGSASIVTGPCYLFRRDLLDEFPEDVVADDVYVALLAAASGAEVRFLDLRVEESRCPRRLGDLYRHKLRKADAYLREVWRFLPRWPAMMPRAREIFIWRAVHLLVIPLLSLVGAGAGVAWIASTNLVGMATVLVAACGVVAACHLLRNQTAIDALLTPPLIALLSAVVLVALVKHPFSKQTANYPKITPTTPADTQEDPIR